MPNGSASGDVSCEVSNAIVRCFDKLALLTMVSAQFSSALLFLRCYLRSVFNKHNPCAALATAFALSGELE
jgi:hypothetical protein